MKALNNFKHKVFGIRLSVCLYQNSGLILLFLLWQVSAWAKSSRTTANEPVNVKIKITQVLTAVPDSSKVQRTTLTDSVVLERALDSLRQQGLTPAALARQVDSLHQAFTQNQQKLSNKLKAIKENLPEQFDASKISQTGKMASPPLQEALCKLQEIGAPLSPERLLAPPSLSNPPTIPNLPRVTIINQLPDAGKITDQVTVGALDHFAGHQIELNQARQKLSKYNGRLEKMESTKELKKNFLLLNSLHGKPWPERVVLGTQWQFSRQQDFIIDLGLSIAWCLTDLYAVGAGFQYRLNVSTKHQPWVSSTDKVYGYHVFSDVQIKKEFFGRLDYEILSTLVPRPNSITQPDGGEQQWIKGLSLGLGKTYAFYKKLNGYALMQYNLMHQAKQTPYLRPLQAKIGFYLHASQLVKPKQ